MHFNDIFVSALIAFSYFNTINVYLIVYASFSSTSFFFRKLKISFSLFHLFKARLLRGESLGLSGLSGLDWRLWIFDINI